MNSPRPELKLDWCSHQAAKYAVEHWHYSKSYPLGRSTNIGAWEDEVFLGALQFRNGANMNMSKPYGLTQWECVELSRVALRGHVWPVSRILVIAVRMLKGLSPGLRLIISYADTLQGHHGGIYQAAGWIYCGVTGGDTEYWIGDRWSKARNFRSADWSKFSGIDYSKLRSRKTPGKHRYLMPLDPDMRAKIAPLAKPYPKRAGSIAGDAPATHAGQGGSIPTPALSSVSTR